MVSLNVFIDMMQVGKILDGGGEMNKNKTLKVEQMEKKMEILQ